MNPFLLGLAALGAVNDPQNFANMAGATGIPPPSNMDPMDYARIVAAGGGVNNLGSLLDTQPIQATVQPQQVMPGMSAVNMAGTGGGVASGPSGGAVAAMPGQTSMLQGIKAPTAPSPVFNGGVSGSQKAPEVSAAIGTAGSPILAQLMAMLGGGRNPDPLRVKSLGALL